MAAESAAPYSRSDSREFMVSQLKAWFGARGPADNDYAYDYLPRNAGAHAHLPMFVAMHEGTIKGFFAIGQNPAVGGQNASFQREALAKLDWMVVRDLFETETASFWKDSPEIKNGRLKTEQIQTEVFFLPAAAVAEMDGSFTNTQRLVQWHDRAVDPPDDARSDIWFTVHLGRLVKERYAKSTVKRDRPIQSLVWNFVDEKANEAWRIKDEPSAELILKEINGYAWAPGKPLEGTALNSFADLKDDGSTACGAWIYHRIFTAANEEDLKRDPDAKGHNHAANRQGDEWVALGWGFS